MSARVFSTRLATLFGAVAAAGIPQSDRRLAARQDLLHDPVTGLLTGAALAHRIDAALTRARRHGTTTGLLLIGVDEQHHGKDFFRPGADHHLSRRVARELQMAVRNEDSIGRLSSGEFAVLLTDVNDERSPARIAQRLLAAIPQPSTRPGRTRSCGFSIGIAITPLGAANPDGLVSDARVALDAARHSGGNRFALSDPDMHDRVCAALTLENDLQQAVDQGQFVVHYQPEIDLTTGSVIGIEALLRWQHPTRGLIPPDQFIPLAEETGHIHALGAWVLRNACHTVRRLQQDLSGLQSLRLNVNVSPRQLTRRFVDDLTRTCRETGIDPRHLVLEITENTFIDDIPTAVHVLADIHRLGVQLAIDDFGIGYSALSYLRDLPIAVIKLDRFFIAHLQEPTSHAIVRAVIQLAETLGLSVTAEGVETLQQHHDLRRLGCNRAQGFLFAHPIPEPQLRAFLQHRSGSPHDDAAPDAPATGILDTDTDEVRLAQVPPG